MKKILLTIAALASFCAAQVITPTNAGRQGRYEIVSDVQDYAAAMTSVSVRGSVTPSFGGNTTVYGKMNYGCCSAPNWIYFWSSKSARDAGDTSASSVIASVRVFSEAAGARTITLNPRHAGTDTIILTFVNTPALSSTGDNNFDLLFMNANSETVQGQVDAATAPLYDGTADLSVNSVEANGYTFPPSAFGMDGNCDECLQVTYPGKSSPYFYVEGSGIGLTGLKSIQADVASFGTIIATDTSWNLPDSVLRISKTINGWTLNSNGDEVDSCLLFFEGASIDGGYGSGAPPDTLPTGGLVTAFPNVFGAGPWGGRCKIYDDGVGGSSMAQAEARYYTGQVHGIVNIPAPNVISPAATGTAYRKMYFISLVPAINSAAGGVSLDSIVAQLARIVNKAHADGWKVVLITSPSNYNGGNAAVILDNLRALANSGRFYYDYFVDFAGMTMNNGDTAFFVDGIHPTIYGHKVLAAKLNACFISGDCQNNYSNGQFNVPLAVVNPQKDVSTLALINFNPDACNPLTFGSSSTRYDFGVCGADVPLFSNTMYWLTNGGSLAMTLDPTTLFVNRTIASAGKVGIGAQRYHTPGPYDPAYALSIQYDGLCEDSWCTVGSFLEANGGRGVKLGYFNDTTTYWATYVANTISPSKQSGHLWYTWNGSNWGIGMVLNPNRSLTLGGVGGPALLNVLGSAYFGAGVTLETSGGDQITAVENETVQEVNNASVTTGVGIELAYTFTTNFSAPQTIALPASPGKTCKTYTDAGAAINGVNTWTVTSPGPTIVGGTTSTTYLLGTAGASVELCYIPNIDRWVVKSHTP